MASTLLEIWVRMSSNKDKLKDLRAEIRLLKRELKKEKLKVYTLLERMPNLCCDCVCRKVDSHRAPCNSCFVNIERNRELEPCNHWQYDFKTFIKQYKPLYERYVEGSEES